jgi:hypothetical protein
MHVAKTDAKTGAGEPTGTGGWFAGFTARFSQSPDREKIEIKDANEDRVG